MLEWITFPNTPKFVVSPDERHIVVIRRSREREDPVFDTSPCIVELIDVQQEEVKLKMAGISGMSYWERSQVAFSSDSKLLAFPTESHTILVWDIDAGRTVHELTGPQWHLNCLRFAPSNRTLAAGGWEGAVWLWDLNSGHLTVPRMGGHGSGIASVHFTNDERTLLTSGDDRTVRAWNTATGQQMLEIGNSMLVESQAILADDSLLVFQSRDGLKVEFIPTLDQIQLQRNELIP